MQVLSSTSCVTKKHNVSVVACVEGCQQSLGCEGREGVLGRERCNCEWQHLVIITHFLPNTFTPELLLYVLFPLYLHLIRPWHVFTDLVLVLIQLALENQTRHDIALHHLAWWCHNSINTLVRTVPHLLARVFGELLACGCVFVYAQISDIFHRLSSDRAGF